MQLMGVIHMNKLDEMNAIMADVMPAMQAKPSYALPER